MPDFGPPGNGRFSSFRAPNGQQERWEQVGRAWVDPGDGGPALEVVEFSVSYTAKAPRPVDPHGPAAGTDVAVRYTKRLAVAAFERLRRDRARQGWTADDGDVP